VSGKVSMKAPYEKLWDPTVWSGGGEINSSELVVEGRTATGVKASGTVGKGVLTITDAALTLEGIPVRAEGTFGLSGKNPFSATVRTTGTDVTDLRKLVPEVEIPAPVAGILETETKVTGTVTPLDFTAAGTVKASKLTLASSTANQVSMKWELTRDRLTISDLKADVFGGSVTGSADVPFDKTKTGKFGVAFKDVDAGTALALVPDFHVRIGGKVTGKVSGEIPPAKPNEPRIGNLDLELTAPRLTVQGIPAEKLVGKAAYKNGGIDYNLEGKTLGGSFEVKGRYPGQKKQLGAPPAGQGKKSDRGSFRLTGADLSRIARDVGISSLAPLGGRVDMHFDFDNDLSDGSGRIEVTRLSWGKTLVARELTAVLLLREGYLELADVNGLVAGGVVRARGRVLLSDTSRNFFSLSITGADAKRLLAPVTDVTNTLQGRVSVVLRGRVGRETRVSGSVTMPTGEIAGIQINDLRIPFELSSSRGGYGRVTVREASGQAGPGRVRGEVTYD